jgi:Uma2 family endonuclease
MSTTIESLVKPDESRQEDPFRYGWRYQNRLQPDGREELVQVPLTLEDVIHPQEGDFRVQSQAHWEDCDYLYSVFKVRLIPDPAALVLADHRVAWDEATGVKPHGPDIAVFQGVAPRTQRKGTLDVLREGFVPLLIVEITSPDTRRGDVVTKVDEYFRAGVPWYVIVDADEKPALRTLQLIGYRRGSQGYERLPLDSQGRLWLEPLGLWLGAQDGRVVCYDGETGEELGDYAAMAQARAVSEARLAAETRARQAAEAHMAAEASARAAAEAQMAAEAHARAAAETRLRELEAELRRLRGEADPK